jgi:hypothetical protein
MDLLRCSKAARRPKRVEDLGRYVRHSGDGRSEGTIVETHGDDRLYASTDPASHTPRLTASPQYTTPAGVAVNTAMTDGSGVDAA